MTSKKRLRGRLGFTTLTKIFASLYHPEFTSLRTAEVRLQATTGNASAIRRLRVHDPHKNFCVGVELIESLSKAFPLLCSPFLGQFVSKPIIATTLTSILKPF